MPYRRNSDLPPAVKDALPSSAQTVFRTAFNSGEKAHQNWSESRHFQYAWGAVRQAGFEKDPDTGKWVKVEKTSLEIPITKVDESQNLVFGWANVSISKDGTQITDSQDDQIDIEELEQAAYEFNLHFREAGMNHEGEAIGKVVESFVVTPEKLEKMGLEPDALPMGWWFGAYIEDDEVFAQVVKGELSMFSIQGTGIREPA